MIRLEKCAGKISACIKLGVVHGTVCDVSADVGLIPCCVCDSMKNTELYGDELNGESPSVDYNFSAHTRKTFRIVKCSSCGHIYVNPMPNLLDDYISTEDDVYLASREQRIRTAGNSIMTIRKFVPAGSRLLDVGCAAGFFLDVATKEFEVEGIEISKWAADLASKNHIVHRKPLSQLDFNERFDVITMFDVIEHFSNPAEEIAAANRALKPGGLLFIHTGDVASLAARILRKKWWWYQGMHLQYFSRDSLDSLLTRHGFAIVEHRLRPVYFSLKSLAHSFARYPMTRPLQLLLSARPLQRIHVKLVISGEMLVISRKL